jgi:hypothetical protein
MKTMKKGSTIELFIGENSLFVDENSLFVDENSLFARPLRAWLMMHFTPERARGYRGVHSPTL